MWVVLRKALVLTPVSKVADLAAEAIGNEGSGCLELSLCVWVFFFTTRVHKNDEEILRPVICMSSRSAPLFV